MRMLSPRDVLAEIEQLWNETAGSGVGHGAVPGLLMLHGRHVVDLSGVESLAQARALATSELADIAGDATVALVGMPAGAPV